ncbi:ABC transporter involved in cytochrome c biogenesis, CcmB subunit [Fimbriimonas ginsengisoli Gsoil 348]|uniref:ABC transporter involved in cytochrome c biogenesis, CcmB subunit n=1 Tax=Fimbriimonas ginsengisoli Gsoil 348 TaxID=661478 RepID=A0A068NR62_FIMGI|nr:ABC transporter involved in cytochrome c biogenesis, CcmB subunit [Fimbriimonas ginsengisoli Gsoil 348]
MAVMRKEFRTELRARSGVLTACLFGFTTVVALAYATFSKTLSGTIAGGLLFVGLLFASVLSMPRTFLVEEEQGTGDMLRLLARPHAVFWGKALFNFAQMLVVSFVLAGLFVLLMRVPVTVSWLLVVSLIGSSASLAAGVTLSGALVAQAANRAALAAAVALPLLLPMAALAVAGFRVALGDGVLEGGISAGIGLICYGVVSFAIGPYLFAAVWKS